MANSRYFLEVEERVPLRMENEFINADSWRGWFQLSIQPVPEGIFILSTDVTDRKRAEEARIIANAELVFQNEEKEKRAAELSKVQMETVRRLHNIETLRAIDQAITGSLDLPLTLSIVLEQVISQLSVDAAAVLLLNPHTQRLEYSAGRGFGTESLQHTTLRLGDGYAGRAALGRQLVHIPDLRSHKTDFLRSPAFSREGFICYFGVPLVAKGEVKGVLEIFHRSALNPGAEWLDFLETLAGQAAIAVDSASLFTSLQNSTWELFNAFDSTIEGWSHAMDLRDKETENHTQRVTEMTLKFSRRSRTCAPRWTFPIATTKNGMAPATRVG